MQERHTSGDRLMKGPRLLIRAFGGWLIMLVAAFLNGALRELVIAPMLGEHLAHIVSVFFLSALVWGIAYVFVRALSPLPSRTLLLVGSFWLVLSVAFEFGFFHYIMHEPWEKLLAEYNLVQGRLLLLVWLSTWLSPLVCSKLRHG